MEAYAGPARGLAGPDFMGRPALVSYQSGTKQCWYSLPGP
jgi:hypothetical protein